MFRHIVEGWSRESYEDAIFAALRRASEYLTRTHDVHVAIKELSFSEAQGYHAVLELSKEVMSKRFELDMEDDPTHREKLEFEHQFRVLRRKEHDHMEHAVAAHFVKIGRAAPPSPVPDFILAPMTDVSVENDEIEEEFDHAAHLKPRPVAAPEPFPHHEKDLKPEPE
jgi:hypothetical protein